MSSEHIDNEIELDDKYLVDKCLLGDIWSKDRAEACKILAMKCNDELKAITSPQERERIRRNIIKEAQFELSENNEDIVSVENGNPFKIWHRSNTIFDEGFDSKNFIEMLKQKKHGRCSIALYGIETQFWSQMNEGLFQNIDNGNAAKDIEKLVFSDHSQYATTPKEVRYLQLRNWMHKTKGAIIEKSFEEAFDKFRETEHIDSISDKEKDILYNYLVNNGSITPKNNFVLDLSQQLKKYRICNDIHNPYLTNGTFKYCSSALSSGKGQTLEIWKRIEGQTKPLYTIPEFEKGIREYVPRSPTIAFLVNSIRNNKRLATQHTKMASKYNPDTVDYTFYTDRAREELETAKMYEQELEMLKRKLAGHNWEQVDSLGCWHNFLDMIEKKDYPDYIKGKQREVEMAYGIGEITEEQAIQLLKDIGKLEEEFVESMKQLEKPVIYQPTRMRLYGSQLALQNLINDAMVRLPFDDVMVDEVTKSNMRRAFMGINLQQLIEHRIFTKEEIDDLLKELDKMDIYQILEKMAETKSAAERAGELLLDYIEEDVAYRPKPYFSSSDIEALELIFGDMGDFLSNDDIVGYDYTHYEDRLNLEPIEREGKKPIIFLEEDREDEMEIEIDEDSTWADMASEAFPAADLNLIMMKLSQKDVAPILNVYVNMYGWYDLNKVAVAAENEIDNLKDLLYDKMVDILSIDINLSDPKPSLDEVYKEILDDLPDRVGYDNYTDLLGVASDMVKIMDFINDKYDFDDKKYKDITADDLLMEYLVDEAEDIKDAVRKHLA